MSQDHGHALDDLDHDLVFFLEGLFDDFTFDAAEITVGQFADNGLFVFLDRLANIAFNGPAAGERLQASAVTAAAFGPVGLDDHVPEFSGGPIGTGKQLTIDDDSAPDAGSGEKADDILFALAGPQPLLPEQPEVDVIVDGDLG